MRLPVTSPPLFTSLQYLPISKQVRDLRKKRKKKCEYAAFFLSFFYSFLKHLRKLVGKISSPVHACRGLGSSLLMDFWNKRVLFHSIFLFLSHTLLSQRCCAVSHAGKVPFPSISGRLQRSVIREINRTGPISCLVPFESAKLLRTSKKMRQFIWGLASLLCKCQTHTHTHKQPAHHPLFLNIHTTQMCTLMNTSVNTVSWSSFKAQKTQAKYETKHS